MTTKYWTLKALADVLGVNTCNTKRYIDRHEIRWAKRVVDGRLKVTVTDNDAKTLFSLRKAQGKEIHLPLDGYEEVAPQPVLEPPVATSEVVLHPQQCKHVDLDVYYRLKRRFSVLLEDHIRFDEAVDCAREIDTPQARAAVELVTHEFNEDYLYVHCHRYPDAKGAGDD